MIPLQYRLAATMISCGVVLGAMFCAGWAWRGTIADLSEAVRVVEMEKAHRKALEDARSDAEASQRAASESERRRLDDQGKERIVYRDIERKVVEYVESHASPDSCGLTDDGLRLWRQARDAEPVDSGEPVK